MTFTTIFKAVNTAQADDIAIGEDDLEPEHIIAGDAVFQAARSAGVRSEVAADEVVGAAGGVRRIKEPAFFHGELELFGDDGGLDDGHKVAPVDLEQAVEAFQGEHDAAAHGDAAAHIAVPGATGRDGDAVAGGEA